LEKNICLVGQWEKKSFQGKIFQPPPPQKSNGSPLRGLRANISEESVRRVCRAFFILKNLLNVLDSEINVKKVSGKHTKKSVKEDLMKVVKTLCEQYAFEKQSTREHMWYCFPDCLSSIAGHKGTVWVDK